MSRFVTDVVWTEIQHFEVPMSCEVGIQVSSIIYRSSDNQSSGQTRSCNAQYTEFENSLDINRLLPQLIEDKILAQTTTKQVFAFE